MDIPRWNIGQALGAIVGCLLGLTFSSAVSALLVIIIGWGSLPFLSCLCAGPVIGWLIGRNSPNKGALVVTGVLAGFVVAFLFSATGIGFLLLFVWLFVWVIVNVWVAGRSGARIGEKLGWVMPSIHISRWAMAWILPLLSLSALAVCTVLFLRLTPQLCIGSGGILRRTGCLHVMQWGKRVIPRFALAPNGDFLATSGTTANVIQFWQAQDGKPLSTIQFPYGDTGVVALSSAEGEPVMAMPYGRKEVQIWHVKDGKILHNLQTAECLIETCKVAFSQDGEMLAVITHKNGSLWQTSDGTLLRTLWERIGSIEGFIRSLTFSPDGRSLAVGTSNSKIYLWSTADGVLVNTLTVVSPRRSFSDNEVLALAYSPDGKLLTSRTQKGVVQLWKVNTGALMFTLASDSPLEDDLAFSPDGTLLAAVAQDGVIHFWNVSDGSQARTYKLPDAPTKSHLAFGADGLMVAFRYGDYYSDTVNTDVWVWLLRN